MGLQPRFVSPAEVEGGALQTGAYRTLILPHAIALSAAEAQEIREFVARGGAVVADGVPGLFDEHGRRQEKPLLSDFFSGPMTRVSTPLSFGEGQAAYFSAFDADHRDGIRRLTAILEKSGVGPAFSLARSDGGLAMSRLIRSRTARLPSWPCSATFNRPDRSARRLTGSACRARPTFTICATGKLLAKAPPQPSIWTRSHRRSWLYQTCRLCPHRFLDQLGFVLENMLK